MKNVSKNNNIIIEEAKPADDITLEQWLNDNNLKIVISGNERDLYYAELLDCYIPRWGFDNYQIPVGIRGKTPDIALNKFKHNFRNKTIFKRKIEYKKFLFWNFEKISYDIYRVPDFDFDWANAF